MANVRQFFMELTARVIFSFPDDNLSKSQGILTKLDACIDIIEIWFGIANGQISSIFDSVIYKRQDNCGVLSFYVFISSWVVSSGSTMFATLF